MADKAHSPIFWKNWQNRMLTPPGGLATPHMGSPGSAPENCMKMNETGQREGARPMQKNK